MEYELCDFPGCTAFSESAVQDSQCEGCNRVFCPDHMLALEAHDCNWCSDDDFFHHMSDALENELRQLWDASDFQALISRASELNNGVKCTVPADCNEFSAVTKLGGCNYLFPVDFEDGQQWLLRIRRPRSNAPMPLMTERVIESEVATYRFIASIGIPVPKVFDYAVNAESSHGFGLAYILLENVKGASLDGVAFASYDSETRTKIFTQYASLHAKLADNPLPAIGSLLRPNSPRVEAFTSSLTGHPLDFGPFTSARAYWTARIDLMVGEIVAKRMYSRNSFDAYLAALFLREQIDALVPADAPEQTQFYLRHMDDKGDHIILDAEHNIAAVVDWEFAWVVPKAQALAAPIWVAENILDEPTVSCAAEAQFASILRGTGREDLAVLAERGRPYFFVEQCFRGDWTTKDFIELNSGALRTLLGNPMTWDEWKAQALVRYADDPILQGLSPRTARASLSHDNL